MSTAPAAEVTEPHSYAGMAQISTNYTRQMAQHMLGERLTTSLGLF